MTVAPCALYTRLRDRYFTFGGYLMDSTVPADLLKLKARLEARRATRKYARQPIPDEFRQAAAEMIERHPVSLVRRILKLDPWRMKKPATQKSDRACHKPQVARRIAPQPEFLDKSLTLLIRLELIEQSRLFISDDIGHIFGEPLSVYVFRIGLKGRLLVCLSQLLLCNRGDAQ
jgi:hypothetical protein